MALNPINIRWIRSVPSNTEKSCSYYRAAIATKIQDVNIDF